MNAVDPLVFRRHWTLRFGLVGTYLATAILWAKVLGPYAAPSRQGTGTTAFVWLLGAIVIAVNIQGWNDWRKRVVIDNRGVHLECPIGARSWSWDKIDGVEIRHFAVLAAGPFLSLRDGEIVKLLPAGGFCVRRPPRKSEQAVAAIRERLDPGAQL